MNLMARTKTNLTLEPLTLGILHYLVDLGETDNLYAIIDELVAAYAEHYCEENGVDNESFKKKAIEMFHKKRRPQSTKSKEQQERDAKKSVKRMKIKTKAKSVDEVAIDPNALGEF